MSPNVRPSVGDFLFICTGFCPLIFFTFDNVTASLVLNAKYKETVLNGPICFGHSVFHSTIASLMAIFWFVDVEASVLYSLTFLSFPPSYTQVCPVTSPVLRECNLSMICHVRLLVGWLAGLA